MLKKIIKNMTDDCIPSNKNLNELLPSNLLSEMDYIEEEEKTDESESWDEGIDVKYTFFYNVKFRIYHIK